MLARTGRLGRMGIGTAAFAALAIALVAAPPSARAQTPRFEPGEPAQITADVIEYFGDRDVYVADGHVRVVQGGRELEARWAAFGASTRIGVASGDVVYRAEGEAVAARFLEFDVDTLDGVVFGAELDMGETGFRIAAEELVRTGEDRYRIRGARFTACRCPDEHDRLPWELHAARSDVHVGGYGTSCNTTLEVLGVPVVWLPWLLYPVKTERQTGLLVPDVSFGNRNGLLVGLPFFWAARENVNVLATPQFSTRRGFKQDLEIEAVYGERSRTELRGAFLHDTSTASATGSKVPLDLARDGTPMGAMRDRGFAAIEHDQDLPLGTRVKIDGAWVTDNQYALDFDDLTARRRDRYLEARAFAFGGVGEERRATFQLTGSYANDLQGLDGLDRDPFLLQRYGGAEAEWLSGPLAGLPWLTSALDVDYAFFGRERDPARVLVGGTTDLVGDRFYDIGIAPLEIAGVTVPGDGNAVFDEGEPLADRGHRLTVHPRMGVPLRPFGALEWYSEGGYRETLYWSDLQGYEERGQITGRSDLSLRLERTYAREGRAPVEHQLVPHVGWAFVDSERGQRTNPLFTPQTARLQDRVRQQALDAVVRDPADVVASTNRLVVGVDSRFYLGRGPTRRLLGEVGVAFDRDFAAGEYGKLVLEGRSLRLGRANARFLLALDAERKAEVAEGLAELWMPLVGRASLLARYRYLRDAPQFYEQFQSASYTTGRPDSFDRISQLSGGVYVPVLDRFILQYRANYSFEGSQFLTNAATVDYVSKCGCWAAGLELSDSRNQGLQVRFRYTILGLGDDLSNPFAKRGGWIGAGAP